MDGLSLARQEALLAGVVDIVRQAGEVVMGIYEKDFSVAEKGDKSPVTQADCQAEALIIPALHVLLPDVPVVAEERVAEEGAPEVGARFWLVDPLDGTKEFISRNGEFTINVALIENGVPVLGVVLAPAIDRLFYGLSGKGAYVEDSSGLREISCRFADPAGLVVLASRSHGDDTALQGFLGGRTVRDIRNAGSSLKLCLVAAGEADVYPRLGRTMEWDIAAGQAVVLAAGGEVEDMQGNPLRYGKPGFENPHFAAWGKR